MTSLRKTIDISGDGINDQGLPIAWARDLVIGQHITVNGLSLTLPETEAYGPFAYLFASDDADLHTYYEESVIGGPGAFAIGITHPKDFVPAIRRKLALEIAWQRPHGGTLASVDLPPMIMSEPHLRGLCRSSNKVVGATINSLKRIQSIAPPAGVLRVKRSFLAFLAIGLASSAFAGDVKPIFDEAAARDFPQPIYDKIRSKIVRQTTFVQVSPEGLVRWSTRTLELVDFVKVPSPAFPDTYLFAMRYVVSVISEMHSLAVFSTSCAVVVVYKDNAWHEPTVLCAPVNLDQPEPS